MEVIRKTVGLFRAKSPSLSGEGRGLAQITSQVLNKKFQTNGFKIPLLGKAETTVRLGIKSWWALTIVSF